MVNIASTMEMSEHLDSLLIAVLAGEPTGRQRQEEHPKEQYEAWNHLDRPRDAESSSALIRGLWAAVRKRGAILDKVLDQDAPRDGPLLKGNDASANLFGGNLGLVDWNDRRSDADGKASDNTANDKQGNAVRRSLEDSAENPDNSSNLDGRTTRELVSKEG